MDDAAHHDLNQSIELDPDNVHARQSRADVSMRRKEYHLAIADLSALLEMDDNRAHIYRLRDWAYAELADYDNALGDLQRAVEIQPGDLTTLTWGPATRFAPPKLRSRFLDLVDEVGRRNDTLATFEPPGG